MGVFKMSDISNTLGKSVAKVPSLAAILLVVVIFLGSNTFLVKTVVDTQKENVEVQKGYVKELGRLNDNLAQNMNDIKTTRIAMKEDITKALTKMDDIRDKDIRGEYVPAMSRPLALDLSTLKEILYRLDGKVGN